MTQTKEQLEIKDQRLQWATFSLSSGFFLGDVVRTAVNFAETEEQRVAIEKVCELMASGCRDEREWNAVIAELGQLCKEHPDSYKESGTWHDGAPSILGLALAYEAARFVVCKLYPGLHFEHEAEFHAYRVFVYLLRAMAEKPESAANCLKWVERVTNLRQVKND
jgi:hypothetical protein